MRSYAFLESRAAVSGAVPTADQRTFVGTLRDPPKHSKAQTGKGMLLPAGGGSGRGDCDVCAQLRERRSGRTQSGLGGASYPTVAFRASVMSLIAACSDSLTS